MGAFKSIKIFKSIKAR